MILQIITEEMGDILNKKFWWGGIRFPVIEHRLQFMLIKFMLFVFFFVLYPILLP